MRNYLSFSIDNSEFKYKLVHYIAQQTHFSFLDSNQSAHADNEIIAGIGCIDELKYTTDPFTALEKFHNYKKDWLFGFLSYDLKNNIEQLTSNHFDGVEFPEIYFFQPKYVFILKENNLSIHFIPALDSEQTVQKLYDEINFINIPNIQSAAINNIQERVERQQYLKNISHILEHIHRGDIYEVNYCMEFFSEDAVLNPIDIFLKLNTTSNSPFSAFFRMDNNYLMCASPERFLKKAHNKILSQPIKGTIKRGTTKQEDAQLLQQLANSDKEKSENVMIVDLVRNDLARTCTDVHVSELFGVYTFNKWHHMISTIVAKQRENISFIEVIKNAFPMGSMTGAPKIRAMQLIEQYETSKRGLYSGAVGYITPNEDFDFNVVIRSILYNALKKYLSFQVGSAITASSVPEKEYEECLLKAKAIFETLA